MSLTLSISSKYLRASPPASLYFCTIWIVNSDIYLLPTTFSNTFSNRFSIISLFHLNIISSFIIYSYFNTHIPIPTPFFANFLFCFILFLMNKSTSDLENDYSLAKNFLSFKEAVGGLFFLFHSLL